MASNYHQCPNCHVKTFSYAKFLQHLQLYHEHEANFKVSCGFNGCPRQYCKINSLRKHVRHKHPLDSTSNEISEETSSTCNEGIEDEDDDDNQDVEITDQPQGFSDKLEELTSSFKRHIAVFFLKLQEKHIVPRVVRSEVSDDIRLLLEYFYEKHNELLKICLQEGNTDIDSNPLLKSLLDGSDLLERCFDGVGSEYQFDKYCLKELGLVEPLEYILGYDQQGRKETFHYVPLLQVLQRILTKDDIWHQVQETSRPTDDAALRDFSHGTIYRSHPFFSKSDKRLRIHLYNDEYEVVNPLGSKRLLHKVSGFYFLLGNLLPKYRSRLRDIHLTILVRYKLVQKYGYEPILKPLIEDLLKLQVEGVDVRIDDHLHNIKGTLVLVSADNLTAHALAGFSCSFSNGRICRYCMCHYGDMPEKIEEESCVLRNTTSHRHQLRCVQENPADKSLYGVNGPCPFDLLPHFDVTKAFPPDVMHDLLEGAVPHVLKLIIKTLHSEGIVTLSQLNTELQKFAFGQNDRSSKPVSISQRVLQDGSIAGKAVEKWTLMRVLPFLIGKFVPEDNACWKLYLLLRLIADIVLSPAAGPSWISYLETIVSSFLTDFKPLFPEKFTPKIHFLVHYPRLIQEYGALRSLWCLRYEAKHLYFKKLASVINNFKNVSYSLAKRYQMRQCWEWQANNSREPEISSHVSTEVPFEKLPKEVKSYLTAGLVATNQEESESVWKTKKIVIDTVKYMVGDFLVLDVLHEEEIPQFVKVLHLIKFRCYWCVCGKLYTTKQFCEHLHAYRVEDSRQWIVFRPGDELDFQALDCYKDEDDNLYIALRHRPFKDI